MKLLNKKDLPSKTCNCRKKEECPMEGNCLASCLVYKAEVKTSDDKKVYYGSCSGSFKERFSNHKTSFSNKNYKEATKLSKYIWELKSKKKQYEIAWSIVRKCAPYRPSSKRCDLCLTEKLVIIQARDEGLLNKRSEIANKCRHSNKFVNVPPPPPDTLAILASLGYKKEEKIALIAMRGLSCVRGVHIQ